MPNPSNPNPFSGYTEFLQQYNQQATTNPIPEPEALTPMSNNYAAPRSLLYLMRRLKKEGVALLQEPNALFWIWFQKTCEVICEYKWINNARELPYLRAQPAILQDLLDRIGKCTGVSLVRNTWNVTRQQPWTYWLKSECKSYWNKQGLQWIQANVWNDLQSDNSIHWDSIEKEWCYKDCFFTVYKPINKDKYEGNLIAFIKGKHTQYQACDKCDIWWAKEHFKYNEYLDLKVCFKCNLENQLTPVNKPHTFATIYGTYHSHHSKWQFYIQRLDKEEKQALPMGVEIEMNLKSGEPNEVPPTMWKLYERQKEFNKDWHNFYTESDGSLSEKGSVEFITNPMTLAYHQKYWELMLPEIRKYCVGWNIEKFLDNTSKAAHYGIHITCHRKYWPDLSLARFMKFLANQENQSFIFAIAQRRIIYRGQHIGNRLKNDLQIAKLTAVHNKKLICSDDFHYAPIRLKDNGCMEIRIFNSTLNQESFLKNLEFVDAFNHWCKETAFSVDYIQFLKWLASHYKHERIYANLLSYLHKDKFGCKHGPPVCNVWKDLIQARPLGQLVLFEPTAATEGLEDRLDVLNHQD